MEVFARDMGEDSLRNDSFRLTFMTTANLSGVPVRKGSRVSEEGVAYGERKGDSDGEGFEEDEELERLILEIVRLRFELLKLAESTRSLTDPEIVRLSRLLDEKFNRL
ncbi:aspartyl-phosphate phosphatase Spo0E family protein [Brockia lithotrophica]|uniref:Spo0E like sporulation regulatory protein n=1 Tax=Brockia lithotrophica TaxID=933949 RepID=A0A660KWS6_9BACL|nr:aspartyl-phosphate phosphatase Spo0E family protein [Brockia lithotrophica]RKQ84178.1 Spo0E like sporulation regulatory protein [Brockia lithotrophica]